MTSPTSFDLARLERILPTVASATSIYTLCREQGYKPRQGIYNAAILVWLMIYQRLNSKGTLSSAVQFLVRQAVLWQSCAHVGKRVQEGHMSLGTSGYCQARRKMPTLVVTSVCEHIFEQLQVLMRKPLPDTQRPVFVIDGTTLRLAHSRELVRAFPPGRNQHGDNHWPTMLMVAFHDAHTGLAAQPSWGPMYGKRAVGEQALASQALQRLPSDAIVMADINFGIFAFAYAVQQSQRPMLFRLNAMRAGKVLRGESLRPGRHRKVVWEASSRDRKAHPGIPEGAVVEGSVVACRHPDGNGEMLYFFTTLDEKPKRILAWYKLRWNIETDLRSLKRTLDLHQVTSKSKDMVEKDVTMAVCAYNVVRAVMYLSASRAGLRPRQLSFSTAQDAVMAAWPFLQRAEAMAEFHQEVERLLRVVAHAKLPERSRKRSYPREIWGRGGQFPFRHAPRKGVRL
jgi:Transposase DDE domain